ncbi:MAG TPA: HWE histidine kinase domain-containing protein [Azospirillaceae bacterium]|nr:HWE histidine kinase domain-containing protein [Azospirillaceae bacterium]
MEQERTGSGGATPAAPVRSVVRLGIAAAVVTFLLFALLAWVERIRVYEDARRDARAVVRQLAEHADKVLGIHALTLSNVQWNLAALGWDRMERTSVVHDWLLSLAEKAPEVQSYWLVDAGGRVRVSSFAWPTPVLNVGDRDYFKAHQAEPPEAHAPGGGSVFVGQPLVGRLRPDIFFTLSRRLHTPDGGFAGVAQVSLLPGYFQAFYRKVVGESQNAVLLARDDGTVLARIPEPGAGPNLGKVSSLLDPLRGGAGPGGDDPFIAPSPVDGVERLYARLRLEGLPIQLIYGIDTARLEAEWYRRMRALAALALGGLGLLLPFIGLAFRNARAAESLNDALERRIEERTSHLAKAMADLRESELRLTLAGAAAGIGVWDWELDSRVVHWSETYRRIWGIPESEPASYDGFISRVHPDDQEEVRRAVAASMAGSGPLDLEFRIVRPDGSVRWLTCRGDAVRDAGGRIIRLTGICRDVSERREAASQQRLLMREVDHRAKNALSVALAIVRLSSAPTVEALMAAIEGRIAALARAHGLLAKAAWKGTDLQLLLEQELAPFAPPDRLALEGPPVQLDPDTVQPLGLALHELGTNAAKHGGLSTPDGRVAIRWERHATGALRLEWRESGGPRLAGPPAATGFGSTLLSSVVGHQLGGTVGLDWRPEGLVCTIELLPPDGPEAAQPASAAAR